MNQSDCPALVDHYDRTYVPPSSLLLKAKGCIRCAFTFLGRQSGKHIS